MKMKIELESQEEREVFERIAHKWQVDCAICGKTQCEHGSVQFMSISMEDYVEITQRLALARTQIKELEARIKEMEKSNG